jgi:hypothetical protein
MLRSDEYGVIKADYDRISREHFEKSYVPPPGMAFAQSEAPFPPAELRALIAAGFETQCRVPCFGPFLSSDEVQARLAAIRRLLRHEPPLCWKRVSNYTSTFPPSLPHSWRPVVARA